MNLSPLKTKNRMINDTGNGCFEIHFINDAFVATIFDEGLSISL